MIGFDELERLYEGLLNQRATYLVYAAIAVIIFFMACLNVAYNTYKEARTGFTVRSVIEIAKPLLPAYLSFTLLPVITGAVVFIISLIFSSLTENSNIDNGNEDLEEYIQVVEESYDVRIAYWVERDKFFDTDLRILKIQKAIEVGLLELVGEITRYLFTFAAAGYFLWLLLLNVFSPFAAVGFLFKDFRSYTDAWIKNYIGVQAFFAAIVLANALSLCLYNLYRVAGDYNLIVHIIFLLMLRGYLYNKSLTFAKSII